MKMRYQIFIDRVNGLELSGCWGSENAKFQYLKDAKKAAVELAEIFENCAFEVCDMNGNISYYRVEARVNTNATRN